MGHILVVGIMSDLVHFPYVIPPLLGHGIHLIWFGRRGARTCALGHHRADIARLCICVHLFGPRWHASHTRSTHFDTKAGSPITTPFDCIARSRWRFMWPIHLCHNSMFVSVLRPFVYIVDFTSFESRMNMQPFLCSLAMS